MNTCRVCGATKKLTEFVKRYYKGVGPVGYKNMCLDCNRRKMNKYYIMVLKNRRNDAIIEDVIKKREAV